MKCQLCDRAVKAKGLCAAHYMRLRRTGDPETVGRAGRPQGGKLARWNTVLPPSWSRRKQYRFISAADMIEECGAELLLALDASARADGTINVAAFELHAAREYLRIYRLCDDGRYWDPSIRALPLP